MKEYLNEYELTTPFTSVNSGTARWCFAQKDGEEYFIKEFMSPTYPENISLPEEIIRSRAKLCDQFFEEKQKLYRELQAADNGNIVPVTHFFRNHCKYYAVTQRIRALSTQAEEVYAKYDAYARRTMVKTLAYNLARVHSFGIVHADLRPANLMLKPTVGEYATLKLIDFDNSFFESAPPEDPEDIHGDPVYFAPETYIALCEEEATLTRKLDIFALGLIFHLLLCGELPRVDETQYHYIYEAVMDGADVRLSGALDAPTRELIQSMLSLNPEDRPTCEQVFEALTGKRAEPETATAAAPPEEAPAETAWKTPEKAPEKAAEEAAANAKNKYMKSAGEL